MKAPSRSSTNGGGRTLQLNQLNFFISKLGYEFAIVHMTAGTFLLDVLLDFRNTDLLLFVIVPVFSFGLLLMVCKIFPQCLFCYCCC